MQQQGTGIGEGREGLELERVLSWRGGNLWWGTRNFGSGEPLDSLHWSSSLGTRTKIRSLSGGGRAFFGNRFWVERSNCKQSGRKGSAPTVGQESEVTDAHKALGKDV